MTNAIVKQSEIHNVDDLARIAKMLAMSGYFDAKGNGDQAVAQIATKILAGKEMGYGPFASVQGIHVIQGRPTLSANLMAAAVKSHPKYNYRVRKMTDQEVAIEFFDGEESLGTSSFTAEDAKKAGTKNTDKFPRNMLFARAMSNGVRWYCPDVFNGNAVYVPEEFDVTVDATQPPLEIKQLADSVGATVTAQDAVPPNAFDDFEAEIGNTFTVDDFDNAMHWLIKRYTTKTTPDNVRLSPNELTVKELTALTEALKKHRKTYADAWDKENTTQAVAA